MASHLSSMALVRWLLQRNRNHQRGFTLTELLIAIIVGSLILGGLLYLVVELMGTNLREERLTQAQQDTRRALDYISRDAQEAVFVYADPTTVANQLTDRPADSIPVLAFWRLTPIDVNAISACPATNNECETLRVRQSVYDLVVYFHRDNSDNRLWSGPGRIIRYELTNYSNLTNRIVTEGYRDPSQARDGFALWTRNGATTDGSKSVLADFIDTDDATLGPVACPSGLQSSTPANSNNFFVCVRPRIVVLNPLTNETSTPLNQSLSVFLRGSTENNNSNAVVFGPTSQGSSLPIISTEVLVRGVIEREP